MLTLNTEKTVETDKRTIIKLENITRTYRLPAGEVNAVDNANLEISTGEFVTIVGQSGSGKTTLLNLITAIDLPTNGSVFINGRSLSGMKNKELTRWRGKNIGIVFQFFQLMPTLTVLENVLLPMDFCNVYKTRDRKEYAMSLLKNMGIASHADKLPAYLSGGENQRAAIARALANNPSIICADEPTGNLDSETSERILNLFSSLRDKGKTILMVTHEHDISSWADRELEMKDGRIISDRRHKDD